MHNPKIIPRSEKLQQSVIETLEELLEEARSGKLESVHIAAFYAPEYGDLRLFHSQTEHVTKRIGALFRLMIDLDGS